MRTRTGLFLFAMVGLPVSAVATTFVLADEQQLAQQADVVVLGKVARVEAVADPRTGGIVTEVELIPEQVIAGNVPSVGLVLREPGGDLGSRAQHFYGSAVYEVGESALVFAQQRPDGRLATAGMAMGKYHVIRSAGLALATRDLGEGVTVIDKQSAALGTQPVRQTFDLNVLLDSVHSTLAGHPSEPAQALSFGEGAVKEPNDTDPFSFLGSPARWFEPDDGVAVNYFMDGRGDSVLGYAASLTAVNAALAAWTNLASSTIELRNAGSLEDLTPGGCAGPNQIVFDDPAGQIADPYFCTGVLAVGGYCTTNDMRDVHGTTFRRITVGKVVFGNGWNGCATWNPCNVSEVLTHELGHTIGIGHSSQYASTMYAYAHFDGRCATLRPDDMAAANMLYPAGETVHDTVLLPRSPVRLPIREGFSEANRVVPLTVLNADADGSGNLIRLVAEDGTCPAGTVERPDFGDDPLNSDQVLLEPGRRARALLRLRARGEAFFTPDRHTPYRCAIEVHAVSLLPGNVDPMPANDRIRIELDVVDYGDAGELGACQMQLSSARPLSLKIAKYAQAKSMVQRVLVHNTSRLGDAELVTVRSEDGDCPPGTVGPVVFDSRREVPNQVYLGAGARRVGKFTLRVDREAFASILRGSPARCRARLVIEGADADGDRSNDVTWMQIDVTDDNDL